MGEYRTRNRDTSIFSDDDRSEQRWRGETARSRPWRSEEHGWGPSAPGDRGFFERAGDEVRSWFGDEEAEQRRERDARATDRDHWRSDERSSRATYPAAAERDEGWSGGFAGRNDFGRSQSGLREGGFDRGARDRFSGHQDDSYRRWRDEQIASLDREYDEYCRHRQQQFEQDFTNFRTGRQSVTGGGAAPTQTGRFEDSDVSVRAAAGAVPGQGAAPVSSGTETVTAGDTQSGARAVRKN